MKNWIRGLKGFDDFHEYLSFDLQWKKSGYSITLRHDFMSPEEDGDTSKDPPGFHVYLHEPRERFTGDQTHDVNSFRLWLIVMIHSAFVLEHGILSSGRIEYLYLAANEEMELKLTVQHFHQFSGRGGSCTDDMFKSRSIVSEYHV